MPLLNTIASATITLYKIEEVSLYRSELHSTNGTMFHPYDTETILGFHIYKNLDEITSSFTDIEWHKYSFNQDEIIEDLKWSSDNKGKATIAISKQEINEKAVIQADAYIIDKGKRKCVASSSITLIDINDLYSSDMPPESPIEGTLWLDTSTKPIIVYSWDSSKSKWTEIGKTTPFVRNLILNSNFWRLNTTNYAIQNELALYNTKVIEALEKNWLELKNVALSSSSAGISQITEYPIEPNSHYTFSVKAYYDKPAGYTGEELFISIDSIDSNGSKTNLQSGYYSIGPSVKTINVMFTTLSSTDKIQVFVGTKPDTWCCYYITELCLYNTNREYPWELAPEDLQQIVDDKLDKDHISVFNALTKNGSMEGFYINTDSEGNEHYYFNATHIQTGILDGKLINAIGLNIRDELSGQSIFHVYKDDSGTHIDMTADNLYIATNGAIEKATTVNYVNGEIINTKIYADNNISTAKTDAISTSKEYTDSQIDTVMSNTSSSVGATKEELYNYIDKQINELSTSSGNTNAKLNALIRTVDDVKDDVSDLDKDLTTLETKHNTDKTSLDKSVTTINNTLDAVNKSINSLNTTVGTKADANEVSSIKSDVSTLKTNTTASAIVNTVRNSTDYKNDFLNKIDKNKVISAINSSTETTKIASKYLDLGNLGSTSHLHSNMEVLNKIDEDVLSEIDKVSPLEKEIESLKKEISNLKQTIEDLRQDLILHIEDSDVHVQ